MAVEMPLCTNIDHHIKVNLESRGDMLWVAPTATWETMQFIRLQMK
jgi:hypothetical protein